MAGSAPPPAAPSPGLAIAVGQLLREKLSTREGMTAMLPPPPRPPTGRRNGGTGEAASPETFPAGPGTSGPPPPRDAVLDEDDFTQASL